MARTKTAEAQAGRQKKRKRRLLGSLIFLSLLAGLGGAAYKFLMQDTEAVISTNPGIRRTLRGTNEEKQRINELAFAFDLPADWKKIQPEQTTYNSFRYQSTKKNAENRYLTIYADQIPLDKAVNKVIAVHPKGTRLTHGELSQNCTEFPAVQSARQGRLSMTARWDGVDFICDLDTDSRNVIGTSAPGSVNSVKLTGPATGAHSFLFAYEDNNYTPEYTIFYNVLDSFTVK